MTLRIAGLSAAIFFALFIIDFFAQDNFIAEHTLQRILGITLLLLAVGLILFLSGSFGIALAHREIDATVTVSAENLAVLLSFDMLQSAKFAITHAKKNRIEQVTPLLLLYALLKKNRDIQFAFTRALLPRQEFLKSIQEELGREPREQTTSFYSDDFEVALRYALQLAHTRNHSLIEVEDMLEALAERNKQFNDLLIAYDLTSSDIFRMAHWYRIIAETIAKEKNTLLPRNLKRYGTIGREWAHAYTITLDLFSRELTKQVRRQNFPRAIGHDKEKDALEAILAKTRGNNVLLVGESGVGKERLVLDLASKIALGECQNASLNYKRIVQLDLAFLISSMQNTESVESTLHQILYEAEKAKNVILMIDGLHNFVGNSKNSGERTPGKIDITGLLAEPLRSSLMPVIALTTFSGLYRQLEQDPAFLSNFEIIQINEISEEEAFLSLEEMVPFLETKYNRFVSYPALKTVLSYSMRYIQTAPLPKKAVDLLDDALNRLARTKKKVLLGEDIAQLVTEKTQIPVGELQTKERTTLLNLEELIHKRIVNQEKAVEEIASALRRARAEVATRKGPMGSFLFLGPTGVGKTETAKALAALYFGSEDRMIRLDMSEFQNTTDIPRLLGVEGEEGLLTTAIRKNPFALILLDELEKAHTNILNLFLQILDEGHVTDGMGRRVDFRNAMIIATSNAGFQLILQAIKEKKDFATLKEEMLDFLFKEGVYRPEFLNRFDGVILFRPLTKENLLDIARLMLSSLKKNLKNKGVDFVVTDALIEKIAELGYDPRFGARDMRRVIQDKVEDAFAVALLNGTLQRGMGAEVDATDFSITIRS